ncbi:MAG: dienelactone hydrolase family protein [Nocardioides sp.]
MHVPSRRRLAVTHVAALLAVSLAGCGSDNTDQASRAPRPHDLGGCLSSDEATLSWYDDDSLSAAVGVFESSGDAGVVVSYEQSGSVCPWLSLAERLSDVGLTVLVYERLDDYDPGEYLPAMVGLLREDGVDHVGLVGGSIGGMASIISAAGITPPVAAVVSLSGASPATIAAAPDLTMPLLQIVAKDDEPFATAAASTDAAAHAAPTHQLVVVRGNAHASVLLSIDSRSSDRVVTFLNEKLSS